MSPEIVTCPPDRFRELLDIDALAFAEGLPEAQLERFERYVEKDRFFTSVDRGRLVASSGIFSFALTVPGAVLPAGGVTFVAVLPSHRRRGLATAMMRRMFEDCRGRGEPVAILWASEGAIYQRFGYGLATQAVNLDAETQAMRFARPWPDEGSIRFVALDEALPAIAPVFDAVAGQRPGFFARSPEWWRWTALFDEKAAKPDEQGEAKRVVVYEGESGPEAYAIYRVKGDWTHRGPQSVLTVSEAIASTPAGHRAIWRFLFDVDLVRTVRAWHLPPDHPLFYLLAEPRRLGASVGDGIWLRVLDVPAALEGRRYGADGRLTFELRDSFCEWNAGCWSLDVDDGRGRVTRSAGEPDLVLDATDLGALYLGGASATGLALAGRVAETRPGALALADRMFGSAVAPWCPQEF